MNVRKYSPYFINSYFYTISKLAKAKINCMGLFQIYSTDLRTKLARGEFIDFPGKSLSKRVERFTKQIGKQQEKELLISLGKKHNN